MKPNQHSLVENTRRIPYTKVARPFYDEGRPASEVVQKIMKEAEPRPLEKANHAFADHRLIRILKNDGELLEPGFITIMYGDIAFRVQPSFQDRDSEFVRMADIRDILFEEEILPQRA